MARASAILRNSGAHGPHKGRASHGRAGASREVMRLVTAITARVGSADGAGRGAGRHPVAAPCMRGGRNGGRGGTPASAGRVDHRAGCSLARDPAAGEAMTVAGGLRMPADVMGAVVPDQLVVHGWDLAGVTGQSFTCDPASTAAVLAFTGASARPLGTGCSARWPMTRERADVGPGARISQPRPAWTPESA